MMGAEKCNLFKYNLNYKKQLQKKLQETINFGDILKTAFEEHACASKAVLSAV